MLYYDKLWKACSLHVLDCISDLDTNRHYVDIYFYNASASRKGTREGKSHAHEARLHHDLDHITRMRYNTILRIYSRWITGFRICDIAVIEVVCALHRGEGNIISIPILICRGNRIAYTVHTSRLLNIDI